MADYKETTIAGNKWTRCVKLTVDNPYQGAPGIVLSEEDVVLVGGTPVKFPSANIHVPFVPTDTVDLYDPTTLQKTGASLTHMEIYGILFSIYLDSAMKRDARIAEMNNPPVDPPVDPPVG